MCVSRFSTGVPADTRGEDVSVHFDLSPQRPDEVCRGERVGDQARYRLAVLRDDQAFDGERVEQSQALLLELCGADLLHASAFLAVYSDQSDNMTISLGLSRGRSPC